MPLDSAPAAPSAEATPPVAWSAKEEAGARRFRGCKRARDEAACRVAAAFDIKTSTDYALMYADYIDD